MFGGDSGGNTDPAPAPAPEPEPEPAPEPDSSPQQPTEGGEIGEWGYISGVTHQPQTISLARSYDDPVVFVGPLSFNGGQEAVARITATTDDSFTVMAQEPGSLDGVHLAESLGYLVVERGTWSLADGTRLEIGEIQSDRQSNGGFERVDFNTNFDATPTVLSQVQTFNDGDFVTTRQSGPSSNGVDLTMQGEEADSNVSRGTETIGYLAIEQGSGSLGGRDFEARTTGNNFDDGSTFAGFSSQIDQSPTLLASLASFNGRDPAVLRHSSLGADGATLTVQEDQSYDGEVTHVDEQVSLLVFDGTSGTLTGDALV
jgi:hypothetical protein